MKYLLYTRFYIITIAILMSPKIVQAAETACSKVSIEILQELTLERIAFDAKLTVTNNLPDKDLSNVRVDVYINDSDGNNKNDIFFLKLASTQNINFVDGTGIISAGTKSEVHWLIIPSPGAGGVFPSGKPYWVGASLSYTVGGKDEVIDISPDMIIVKPEAELIFDYFMPFKVLADNPFTEQVESPVPFPLGVRVLNNGYGTAKKLKIDSAQPEIVANDQGLLVSFRLLWAAVNDSIVAPTLTVDIGDLLSKDIATGYWGMISTLSGKFVKFSASFSHSSDLGGELTSLIKETNAHYLVHMVKVNLPDRDDRLDFLADTDRDEENMPDSIFESEIPSGSDMREDSVSPVAVAAVAEYPPRPTPAAYKVDLTLTTGDDGWIYTRLPDPSMGMLKLFDVVRGDGIRLDKNNFWISEELDDDFKKSSFNLHLLDFRADNLVSGRYTLVFEKPAEDIIAPITELVFNGPFKDGEIKFITPQTMIILSAQDNAGGSGVGQMFRKLNGVNEDFEPAFPMAISNQGPAVIGYFSEDRAGNRETVKETQLFVDDSPPVINEFSASPDTISPSAPENIAVPRTAEFRLNASDETGEIFAVIKIAKGESYLESNVVRTIELKVESAADAVSVWDGTDDNGNVLSAGAYTAVLNATDGLGSEEASHSAVKEIRIAISEWFDAEAIDPNPAEQLHPDISGNKVVWQDMRNGNWDIYMKDLGSGSVSVVSGADGAQERPSIDGGIIVWQDNRSGNWDIYGFDIQNNQEFLVHLGQGNQELPVVSGDWIVWQDDAAGNRDIYAKNISTGETRRITSHERDQLHPAVEGGSLVWEDYRHGLGEIYSYDFASGTESRLTYDLYNQMHPVLSNSVLAWTDLRNGRRDIYYSKDSGNETKATYAEGEFSEPCISNSVVVYTEGLAPGNTDLFFVDTLSGRGARLTSNSYRQEEPSFDSVNVVWQDNSSEVFQIYAGKLVVADIPVKVKLRPGFNLIAVGALLRDAFGNSSGLTGLDYVEKVVTYNSLNGIFIESSDDAEFELVPGMGIGVYASEDKELDVASSGESADITLLPGTNYVGLLAVPENYTSHELLDSIGLSNVISVRKFDADFGEWKSAAVRETGSGTEIVGVKFGLARGEGVIITMKNRVDGWRP